MHRKTFEPETHIGGFCSVKNGPGIDNALAFTTYISSETNSYYYLTDHLDSVLAIHLHYVLPTKLKRESVSKLIMYEWARILSLRS